MGGIIILSFPYSIDRPAKMKTRKHSSLGDNIGGGGWIVRLLAAYIIRPFFPAIYRYFCLHPFNRT